MPRKITLKIETVENGKTVMTEEQREIRKIKVGQFTKIMGVVSEIMKKVKDDEGLKELFSSMTKPVDVEDEEALQQADANVIAKAVDSFQTLAVHLPEQAFKLLSIISRVEIELLEEQDFDEVFDIYDAVLEENNIDELIERAKKSLTLTQTKFKFKALTDKVKAGTAQ